MKKNLFIGLLCVFMFTSASCSKDVFEIKKYKNEVSSDEFLESYDEITNNYEFEDGKDYTTKVVSYFENVVTKVEGETEEVISSITKNFEEIKSCDFENEILHIEYNSTQIKNGKEEKIETDNFIFEESINFVNVDVVNKTYKKYIDEYAIIMDKNTKFVSIAKSHYGLIGSSLGGDHVKYYIDKNVYTCVDESNTSIDDEYGKYDYEHFSVHQSRYSSDVEVLVCEDSTVITYYDGYKTISKSTRKIFSTISYSDVKLEKIDLSDFEYIDR